MYMYFLNKLIFFEFIGHDIWLLLNDNSLFLSEMS